MTNDVKIANEQGAQVKTQRFASIDIMKCFAAFLVICLHISFPGIVGAAVSPVSRVAVPFFYMVSGFFLWNDHPDRVLFKIRKHIKYALFLILVSNCLFLIWKLTFTLITHDSIKEYLGEMLSIKTLTDALLLNESPFSNHLWYLNSYLYVLLVFYCAVKRGIQKFILYLIPVLLSVNLLIGKYSMMIWGQDFDILLSRNFLLAGIPFFAIGIVLKKEISRVKTLLKYKHLLLAGGFFFLFTSVLEEYYLSCNNIDSIGDIYISTTPAILCFFVYALLMPNAIKWNTAEKIGREYSLIIYIIHPIFIIFFDSYLNSFPPVISAAYLMVSPIVIFIIALVFAFVWKEFIVRIVHKQ